VVSKIGSSGARPEDVGTSRLWISDAAGWLTLDKSARRVVGDVIVCLNLAESGETETRKDRLDRVGGADALPPCLTERGGRAHLRIDGGQDAVGPRPGSSCMPGCQARLCPYPPPGQRPHRGELSEAFSRDQREILHRLARAAPWQRGVPARELKKFWEHMEARARL
jgi:hypothetical protein